MIIKETCRLQELLHEHLIKVRHFGHMGQIYVEMKSRPVRFVPAPASPQIPHNLHRRDPHRTAEPLVP